MINIEIINYSLFFVNIRENLHIIGFLEENVLERRVIFHNMLINELYEFKII